MGTVVVSELVTVDGVIGDAGDGLMVLNFEPGRSA